MPKQTKPPIERFMDYVSPEPNSGCWLWLGSWDSRPGKGYGYFFLEKLMGAHRASWMLFRGPIPEGQEACHKCDNPACVNPDHLFLGTRKENVHDSIRKGRHVGGPKFSAFMMPIALRGEAHGRARLTNADVLAIRQSPAKQRDLAAKYGVSQSTIWRARKTHWKHI